MSNTKGNDHNEYLIHFIPGEIIMVVDHNTEDLSAVTSKIDQFFSYVDVQNIQIQPINYEGDIHIFPDFGESASHRSFVKVKLLAGEMDDDQYIQDGIETVVNLMNYLYQENRDYPEIEDFFVQSVTPNWLNAGSQGARSDGGPGGPPFIPSESEMKPIILPNNDFDFTAHRNMSVSTDDQVDVVVLDTIPISHISGGGRLEVPAAINATIYNSLTGVLRIYGDPLINIYPKLDTDNYNGTMPDHGLFIAGIIHQIAPKLENIHLIQVLNNNGVGTVDSLIRGINQAFALTKNSTKPLVINMSLTFSIPVSAKKTRKLKFSGSVSNQFQQAIQKHDQLMTFIEHNNENRHTFYAMLNNRKMAKSIDQLLEVIRTFGCNAGKPVHFIAAAGNDADDQDEPDRPEALFPAAFPYVTGVGALNNGYAKNVLEKRGLANPGIKQGYAKFSNQADLPKKAGIRTLGQNIVGPYLGLRFIDDTTLESANDDGIACWSGTSFATGIVSGAVALMLLHKVKNPLKILRNFQPDAASPTHDFGAKQE